MITIILFIILGIAYCYITEYKRSGYLIDDDYALGGLLGLIMGSLIGCAIAIIITACTLNIYKYEEHVETKILLPVNNQINLSEQYFLISDLRNGELTLFAYYQENNILHVHNSEFKCSEIKYTEEQPKLEIHRKIPAKRKWYMYFGFSQGNSEKHIYYIPKESIQMNFILPE